MKTEFMIISIFAFIGVAFFAYLEGLDIRKRSSWIYGVICVLLLISNLGLSLKSVVMAVSIVAFMWIEMIVCFKGLDLSKRASWLYGAYGFLCGLALGTAMNGKLSDGIGMGVIVSFLTLFGGATMRSHKLKYGRR
jgi:hypothetical protein